MKILILGTGKSGTTALVFKMAGGLPNCQAFSGGKPGKYIGNYENAVYKHTYNPIKGKTFDLYIEHLLKEKYDRQVWMARDPRDVAVSRMLYRWQKGVGSDKDQYQDHLSRVLQKEKDPNSISFAEIYRYSGFGQWPMELADFVAEETKRYAEMSDFVRQLGDDWYLFTYEAMVAKQFESLERYLGFKIDADGEVPANTGKAKVIRKKSTGDWRNWFTAEDVEMLKPAYKPYMDTIGYDFGDWAFNPEPVIEAQYSSEYMQQLVQRAKRGPLKSVKKKLGKLFS